MREIEARVRNMAAHEIVSITDEKLKKMKIMSVKQIFQQIKRLMVEARIPVTEQDWKSYDRMNQIIIREFV